VTTQPGGCQSGWGGFGGEGLTAGGDGDAEEEEKEEGEEPDAADLQGALDLFDGVLVARFSRSGLALLLVLRGSLLFDLQSVSESPGSCHDVDHIESKGESVEEVPFANIVG
jgi:hypothetical protein